MTAQSLIPLIIQVSLFLIVASAGLQAQWGDVRRALQQPRLLLGALASVNVAVPLAAVLATLVLPIEPVVKAGIIIMAVSPMAPFVPAKMFKAGAESSVAVGLYFILMVASIAIVPATIAILSTIFEAGVTVAPEQIAKPVLEVIFLPLISGMLVATFLPRHAARLARIASLIGLVAMLPVIVLILWKFGGQALALMGDGTLIAIGVAIAAGLAAGHFLGGPEPSVRIALANAAATRHPGMAAVVVQQNYDDSRALAAVILFLLASILISGLYSSWAGKRLAARPPDEALSSAT